MGLITLTGLCWQSSAASSLAIADEAVLLIGGHGADSGARCVLKASGIGRTLPASLRASGGKALHTALERLATRGVTRLYVHLYVDSFDAGYAATNE